MNRKKMRILLVLLLVSAIDLCSNAQYHQRVLDMMNNKGSVEIKQDVPFDFRDSESEKEISSVVADNLDALLNTWYVKRAFKVDSLKKISRPQSASSSLTDSVFIDRLKNLDSFINLPFNQTVKNLIGLYTNKKPGLVSLMMGLSGYYFPLFEEALVKYNLPVELKYLPVIESALNPKAISRVKATGLWQFMYGTAQLYGLEMNSYVDERFDPIKSTEAAVKYLRDLHDIYGDWHTAIAAYNCGPGNVNKAIRRSGGKKTYWEIYKYLPKETRGYVPTFIAATYAMNYAGAHQIKPTKPSFNLITDTVKLNSYYHFEQISAKLDMPIEELRQLNPQYRYDIIPAKENKTYVLKLPLSKIPSFIDMQGEIYAYNREKYFPNNEIVGPKENTDQHLAMDGKKKILHTVKSGENPGSIAKKHHVRTADLVKWNNIRNNKIKIGQKLAIYIPAKSSAQSKELIADASTKKTGEAGKSDVQASANTEVAANSETKKPSQISEKAKAISKDYTLYDVRSGDSIYTIAKKFSGVSPHEIIALNQIKNTKGLMPGQKLKIPVKDSN